MSSIVPIGHVQGVLFDLDGTLYVGDDPIPGAVATIETLRAQGIRCHFLTNTTRKSVSTLHRDLDRIGLPIDVSEISSSVTAGVAWLRQRGSPTVHLVIADDARRDFAEFGRDDEFPDVVVLGDIGRRWSYDLLDHLFRLVLDGAEILALHKGRYWREPDGLRLDIGAFVAGLEYATGKTAEVVGKPSAAFFTAAMNTLGTTPAETLMVGDDVIADVGGAQGAGLRGVLVRTGKFREDDVVRSGVNPDLIVDSVAVLPAALGLDDVGERRR